MTLQTIGSIIRGHAERAAPDASAITYGDDVLSWQALEERTNRRARQLQAAGVGQDDLVAITLPNGTGFHEAAIATWKAGATPCILSSRLPGREVADIIDVARPKAAIGSLPDDVCGVARLGLADDLSAFDPGPTEEAAPTCWKAVTSGGSTGRPKIIVDHTPGRMDPATIPMTAMGLPPGGVMLNPGPLYHNGPFLFTSFSLLSGAHVVGMERFDAEEALRLIEAYKVDWVSLVPTMMHRIWALPEAVRARYDLSSLRAVWHMAAPCPPWLKHFWIDWLGPDKIWETYAGTEASGTIISGAEWLNKPGSVGYASPDRFRVLRNDGSECDPGEVGEIVLPSKARDNFHYLGSDRPDEKDATFSLGDLGYVDADRYLFLADRRTDLILRGGANVYPAEVEATLDEHPLILSSAVIGLPSPDLGQEIHAIVQVRAGERLKSADLGAFLADRLAAYKRPRTFEIVGHPLRDDAGKLRRSSLRDERIGWRDAGREFALPIGAAV